MAALVTVADLTEALMAPRMAFLEVVLNILWKEKVDL